MSAEDPLVIRSLEFMGGMAAAGSWRPDSQLPEVAFVGRSNVGKSSLLNKLVRRKAFARVSRTPGSGGAGIRSAPWSRSATPRD